MTPMAKGTQPNAKRSFRRGSHPGGAFLVRCLALAGLAILTAGCTGLVPGLPV